MKSSILRRPAAARRILAVLLAALFPAVAGVHAGGTSDLIVDDAQAAADTMQWPSLTNTTDAYANSQRQLSSSDPNKSRLIYRCKLPADGYYRVYMWIPKPVGTGVSVCDRTPVEIQYRNLFGIGVFNPVTGSNSAVDAPSTDSLAVAQNVAAAGWVELGVYPFKMGRPGTVDYDATVTLSAPPSGTALADAVRFVPFTPDVVVESDSTAMVATGAGSLPAVSKVGTWSSWNAPHASGGVASRILDAASGSSVSFTPNLPVDGWYDLYLYWPEGANVTRVNLEVVHADRTTASPSITSVAVQGSTPVARKGGWRFAGTFRFPKTSIASVPGRVRILTTGTSSTNYMVADAVRFAKAGTSHVMDYSDAPPAVGLPRPLISESSPWQTADAPDSIGKDYSLVGTAEASRSMVFSPLFQFPSLYPQGYYETAYYDVYLWWPKKTGAANNTPIQIQTSAGLVSTSANQSLNGKDGVWLGRWMLNPDTAAATILKQFAATTANGIVLADAISFVRDPDGDNDGLSDFDESLNGTKIANPDTDGDGVDDKTEIDQGSNPLDAGDRGVAPPADQLFSITVGVGDVSVSQDTDSAYTDTELVLSEMAYRPNGTVRLDEVRRFGNAGHGEYRQFTGVKLRKGRTYCLTLHLLSTSTDTGTGYDHRTIVALEGNAPDNLVVEDPDLILSVPTATSGAGFQKHNVAATAIEGKVVYIRAKPGQPCDHPSKLDSLNEASGPSYRKIALNGLPLSDSKPQAKEESDTEREETFIDALTQQLRHSTTDIYVPLSGGQLSLSVRRDAITEVWGTHPGMPPEDALDKPFGMGWTTNLCPHIEFVRFIKNTPAPDCASEQAQPDTATVVDENGASHRFFRIWRRDAQSGGIEEAYLPFPSNRNEGEAFLNTLSVLKNADGTVASYVFRKKHGTTVTYLPAALAPRTFNTSPVLPTDQLEYTYARAAVASDRLGNALTYTYADTSLVPSKITANGTRSLTITKQAGIKGKITAVTDSRGFATTYTYPATAKTYTDPYRGVQSIQILKTVVSPESTTTTYSYEIIDQELDWTPKPATARAEYYYHLNLSDIQDPNGQTTTFTYQRDLSRKSYSSQEVFTGFYPSAGQPRVVSAVTFPLLTSQGQTQPAQTTLTSLSNVAVAYDGTGLTGKMRLFGQRMLQVTDPAGNTRTYEFLAPQIDDQNAFRNLLFGKAPDDERSTPFLVLYTQMRLTHPQVDGTSKSETFTFDPAAGMAVSEVRDFSGNVTRFEHSDAWQFPPELSWIPPGYFASRYADPTAQTNARGKTKRFTYSPERIMKEVIDEEGRRTVNTVQPGTGLRLSEEIYSPTGTLMTRSEFQYGARGFMTQKKVVKQAADPAWARDLVSNYVPDANDNIAEEQVVLAAGTLVTKHTFDANGNRLTTTDPRLSQTKFTYDKLNRLTKVTYPAINGTSSTRLYTYDARGNKVKEVNERGKATLFVYDEWNRLWKQAVDMDGDGLLTTPDLVTRNTYNLVGSLVALRDPNGNTTTTAYDALQRPTATIDAIGNQTLRYYDGLNPGGSAFDISAFKPTSTLDPRGYRTIAEYDALYRPVKVSKQYQLSPAIYAISETEYDEVGNAVKVWDPLNPKGGPTSHAIITAYDALNRPVSVTAQDGTTTSAAYTGTGLKWKTTDERGNATETEFDAAGRPVLVRAPAVPDELGFNQQPLTQNVYDGADNLTRVINALGKVWDYTFDARNRKIEELAPQVNDAATGLFARPRTTWTYSATGKVTAVTDPRGLATNTGYDAADRPITVQLPSISYWNGTAFASARPTTTTAYDDNGNVTSVTNPNGGVTRNTYDKLNRLLTTSDPLLNVVTYTYDAAGNRLTLTDARGKVTTMTYDGLNRLLTQTDPAAARTAFAYDAVNKVSRTDALARTTLYFYDARHRLKETRYQNAANTSRTLAYDLSGNLLSVTESDNAAAACATTYDALNRAISETSRGATHIYRYDLAGQRRSASYGLPGGAPGANGGTQSWVYDDAGRLIRTEGDGAAIDYACDLAGLVLTQTTSDGTVTRQTYDGAGRLTLRTVSGAANALLQSYSNGYDLAGNLRRLEEAYADTARNRVLIMTYDAGDRMTKEKVTPGLATAPVVTTTYVYDKAGNRTSKAVASTTPAGVTTTSTWTYTVNTLDQVTAVTGPGATTAALTYDAAGNRLTRTGTAAGPAATYSYDFENRLTGLVQGGVTYAYAYDYRSRRVTRTEGAQSMEVVFSGGLARSEQSPGGTVTAKFVRGRDLGGGVDGLLASVRADGLRFAHSNSRGDVTLEVDGGGTPLYQATYEAYGKRTFESGSTPDRQRANTKEEDPTGLLNEGMRYRDLELGCFLTRDPAGFVDGPNMYAYVRQNPWSKFDPDGLAMFGLYESYGDYFSDMGDVWKGYGDSVTGLAMGVGHMVAHPVQTAKGLGHAVAHPIDTGKAIWTDTKGSWERGNRGRGKVVGDVLVAIATSGVGAETSGAAKVVQAERVMAQAERAVVQLEKSAMKTVEEAAEVERGIWRTSKIDAAKMEHIFSADHVKSGIMSLGDSKKAILAQARETLMTADQAGKLGEGMNTVVTKMNGLDATVRAFFKKGEMQSMNVFKGTSKRIGKNVIDVR